MKRKVNRNVSWFGYLLVGITTNGIFGIYLINNNPGTSLFNWILLGLLGEMIIILKTLRFPVEERFKLVLADLAYLFILVGFGLVPMPRGVNILIEVLLLCCICIIILTGII